jgi:hypothetical protein
MQFRYFRLFLTLFWLTLFWPLAALPQDLEEDFRVEVTAWCSSRRGGIG